MIRGERPYPSWVCLECGLAASPRPRTGCSTWHNGKCDVCRKEKAVTQPRDFGYPDFEGHTPAIRSARAGLERHFLGQ